MRERRSFNAAAGHRQPGHVVARAHRGGHRRGAGSARRLAGSRSASRSRSPWSASAGRSPRATTRPARAIGTGASQHVALAHDLSDREAGRSRGPGTADYYMHHPLGVFWTVAVLGKLLTFFKLAAATCRRSSTSPATTWLLWPPGTRAVGRDSGGLDRARLRRAADHAGLRELPRPRAAGDVRVRAVDLGLRPPGAHLGGALRGGQRVRVRVRAEPRLAGVHVGRVLPGRAVRVRLHDPDGMASGPLRGPFSFGRYWAAISVVTARSASRWSCTCLRTAGASRT